MKIGPVSGTVLLLALATLFTANLPGQPQSAPKAPSKNSAEPATESGDTNTGKRKIPCKTTENASLCYWTHGRLAVYSGGAPNFRLWKIGTRRIVGVFSGPSHFPPAIEEYDENPELPATLLRAYEADNRRHKKATGLMWGIPPPVFADFEICPLEPEHKGWMQDVCIESATNIFIEKHY